MASPIVRKKRNFKALQLDVTNPVPTPTLAPAPVPAIATRLAPSAPAGRRKPPAMDLSKSKVVPVPAQEKVESPGLLSVAAPNSAPTSATSAHAQRSTYHHKLTDHLASLEISNPETKLDLNADDLKNIGELGAGNGGTVNKVEHVPTGTLMAKKVCDICYYSCYILTHLQVVLIDAKPAVRKQILRELQIMHDCNSQYIVSFYGAFVADPHICICMEYMDKGSLDGVYKRSGPIAIEVVGKIALAVLEGLTYLYDSHRIIHRGSALCCTFYHVIDW